MVSHPRKVTGVPYEQIARAGGGIRSSARALQETADETVLAQAQEIAGEMLRSGTTTFECKSGYGLSTAGELRSLELATELAQIVSQVTTRTALLAHAVPDGYTTTTWMDEVEKMLPEALEHASALDIFVESIAFGLDIIYERVIRNLIGPRHARGRHLAAAQLTYQLFPDGAVVLKIGGVQDLEVQSSKRRGTAMAADAIELQSLAMNGRSLRG